MDIDVIEEIFTQHWQELMGLGWNSVQDLIEDGLDEEALREILEPFASPEEFLLYYLDVVLHELAAADPHLRLEYVSSCEAPWNVSYRTSHLKFFATLEEVHAFAAGGSLAVRHRRMRYRWTYFSHEIELDLSTTQSVILVAPNRLGSLPRGPCDPRLTPAPGRAGRTPRGRSSGW